MTKETIVKYNAAETEVEVAKFCIIYMRDSEDGKARIRLKYSAITSISVEDNNRCNRLYDKIDALLLRFVLDERTKGTGPFSTEELERRCRACQAKRTGEGYGDDVPPKIGVDDVCDSCETALELRRRLGITQATAVLPDEEHETVAGIVREMRDYDDEAIENFATRIEAAHDAEVAALRRENAELRRRLGITQAKEVAE